MSTVQIACPTCQARIRAPEAAIGRTIRCPQCRNPFTAQDSAVPPAKAIPTPSEVAPDPNAFAFDDATVAASPLVGPNALDSNSGPVELHRPPPLTPPPPPGRTPSPPGSFREVLAFRRLVSPGILVGLHYLGCVLIVLGGLGSAAATVAAVALRGVNGGLDVILLLLWLAGLFVGTLLGLIFWRVLCEFLLVVFRLHEVALDIRANTARPGDE